MRRGIPFRPTWAARLSRTVLLVSFAGLALLALAYATTQDIAIAVDASITGAIQALAFPGLEVLMHIASVLGGEFWSPGITVVVAAVLAVCGRRRDAALVLLTLLIRLPNVLVKEVVDRPRPSTDMVQVVFPVNETSFPSGHAGGALIFLGLLAYLTWLRSERPALRLLVLMGCVVAILLIGVSRIYLGAHWPSDVLGGYAYGGVMLGLLIEVHRRLERRSASAAVAVPADEQAIHRPRYGDAIGTEPASVSDN
jgi:undecaprenyl-diphosphatase